MAEAVPTRRCTLREGMCFRTGALLQAQISRLGRGLSLLVSTDRRAQSAEDMTDIGNPGTMESAIVDMALLSSCNDLVVTISSSFGYVAAAWAGIAPVYMVYGRHLHAQNPYWYR